MNQQDETSLSEHDGATQRERLLISEAAAGSAEALGELWEHYTPRLRRIADYRIVAILRRRVSADEVLQEAYLDVQRGIRGMRFEGASGVFLWFRGKVTQKVIQLYRRHLNAEGRDIRRELNLHELGDGSGGVPDLLAEGLTSEITPPSQRVRRTERCERLRQQLQELSPDDCEIIELRFFEQLENRECANVLGITGKAAHNRFVRAMKRLEGLLGKEEEWLT